MQTVIRTIFRLGIVILLATSAMAAVSISTDKATYLGGEIVQITVTNTGPLEATFNSDPFVSIFDLDNGECIFGCIGLPVMTLFPAGATEIISHDTGNTPDSAGAYRVYVSVLGPPIYADYTLTGEVAVEALSWGAIKALYRD